MGPRQDGAAMTALLQRLERLSKAHPDWVLRLDGVDRTGEPFELLLFRGVSSSVTHPTAFDPDAAVLPDGVGIEAMTLLAAPLQPDHETVLLGPLEPDAFLLALNSRA